MIRCRTHRPLLGGVILHGMEDDLTFVSSPEECAKDVYRMLVGSTLMRPDGVPKHQFLTTGDPQEFESIGRRFLGPELVGAQQYVGGLA